MPELDAGLKPIDRSEIVLARRKWESGEWSLSLLCEWEEGMLDKGITIEQIREVWHGGETHA